MSQLYSRCLVFPASFCLFISFSLRCFDAFSLFAHVHSAVSLCTSFFLPILLSYCLACRYTLKHTHTFSPSLPIEEVLLFPGRLGGLVVERWGRREGEIEEVHMVKLQKRNNVFLLCPIFLCLHVFLFIIFYFLYRPCDQSLMNLPASFSGRSPMCRTYIYSTVCTCVFLEMFGISDKESGSYFLVWLWTFWGGLRQMRESQAKIDRGRGL